MTAARKPKPKRKAAPAAAAPSRAPKGKAKAGTAPKAAPSAAQRAARVPPDVSHVPTATTRTEVRALAHIGIQQTEIADYLDIDPKTLRKHYAEELRNAVAKANTAVAQRLWRKAIGGDTACMIFWLKARAGWSEKQQVAVTTHTALPASVHEFV